MIQFKKVIVHNFGSYGHSELDLQNRGFCLVSGQNNYIKDNALSNGSGKSFMWSAICYALTGETISGIKSNLKNINIDEPDCYVQIEFIYNKDLFCITRHIAPKSDLKISKNDIDVSGKGIRESEKKLQELLPDLTKDLVASTIIIGQGMPNKFSSFSPSGRKELLEKLTKSDFMIDDLKTRIQARQQELSTKVREYEDSILVNKSQLNNHLTNLDKLKTVIANQQQPDFDVLIEEQKLKVNNLQQETDKQYKLIVDLESRAEEHHTRVAQVSSEKAKVNAEELSAYTASYTKLNSNKTSIELNISNIKKEIKKLQSITDTCPTCGQHLPNVVKPDTSVLERQLSDLLIQLENVNNEIRQCNKQHEEYLIQIDNAFSEELAMLNNTQTSLKQELQVTKTAYSNTTALLEGTKTTYNKLIYDKQNWDAYIAKQQCDLEQLELEVSRLTNLIAITSISKEDLDNRVAIVKKMDSLIRRDFRGYLLTNIISYIDSKAKTFCSTVFGTKELSINLNGNALDITYCGKAFDSLSGGEKQRVDLILQLAIRDLLNNYLDISANILVLDEITDFLDKKSCQAVMNLLEKELNTVESVFIISHHVEELEIPVDSEVKVIKNENGISELY